MYSELSKHSILTSAPGSNFDCPQSNSFFSFWVVHRIRAVLGKVLGGCEQLWVATEARPSALGVSGVMVGQAAARMEWGEGELVGELAGGVSGGRAGSEGGTVRNEGGSQGHGELDRPDREDEPAVRCGRREDEGGLWGGESM